MLPGLMFLVFREPRPFSDGRSPFDLGKDKLLRGLAFSVEFLMRMRQKLGKKQRTKRTSMRPPFSSNLEACTGPKLRRAGQHSLDQFYILPAADAYLLPVT